MKVILSVVAGPHQGRTYEFTEHDHFLVGRASFAQFRLPQKDPYFSRSHFMIEVNPPLCRLLDLRSTNGTFLNGQKVDVAELHHGDEIVAGDTFFRVAIGDEISPLQGRADPRPSSRPAAREDFRGTPLAGIPVVDRFPLEETRDAAIEPAKSAAPSSRPSPPVAWKAVAIEPPAEALPSDWKTIAAATPQPLPGFLMVDELGRGAMGVVSRAVRERDQRVVAVKIVMPSVSGSEEDIQRFLREVSILKSLDHPHIVRCLEQGESAGRLYFVMEYVKGGDSKRLVQQNGPLSVSRGVALVMQLLDALEYAHDRGYVHRDIKPSNVLITQAGGDFVKLADFGLARTYQTSKMSGLTQLGTMGGTVPYMPPEQITNYRFVTPASDQYSAAATLYYLLSGRQIYDFSPHLTAQLSQILTTDPIPLSERRPELPPGLCAIVMRALHREPSKRYPTIGDFQRALANAASSGSTAEAIPAPPKTRPNNPLNETQPKPPRSPRP